jgi:hypothetical protein
MGMDGLLYGVVYNSFPANVVYALDPVSMNVVKRVALTAETQGSYCVADAQGNLYTFGNGWLNKLSPAGALIHRVLLGGSDIDISDDGKLLTNQGPRVVILDTDLNVQTFFPVRAAYWGAPFVAWDTYQTPATEDRTPPAVTATVHHFDRANNAVSFTFSENVAASLAAGDVLVRNVATGEVPAHTLTGYDAAMNTATFAFSGPLANGSYRATLSGAGVADPAGNLLPADYVFEFFVLAGDVNRDRAVNGSDFALLAGSFGRSGQSYGNGDLNGDGAVNGTDFAILAGNFGKSLPAPTPAPAVRPNSIAPVRVPAAPQAQKHDRPHGRLTLRRSPPSRVKRSPRDHGPA